MEGAGKTSLPGLFATTSKTFYGPLILPTHQEVADAIENHSPATATQADKDELLAFFVSEIQTPCTACLI